MPDPTFNSQPGLVPADINVAAITNTDKTGVFDVLMRSIDEHISREYTNGRIAHNDYATVYLGSLQSTLRESIQFALQEQLIEAQVAGAIKDNELKDINKDAALFPLIANLEKNWGYSVTLDPVTGQITSIVDAEGETGKVDKEIEAISNDILLKKEQTKGAYSQRVLTDKQTAKLGLDNVMRQSETSRNTDPDFVYAPKYNQTNV